MARSTIFTAIAYANAKPHLGHAYEYVLADSIARFEKLRGEDVFFQTGMDEYGQKIFDKAQDLGKTPQELVDSIAMDFKKLNELLQVNFSRFIKTTDADHKKVVQDLWMKMFEAGDIYQKEYSGLYCVGCESYKTKFELTEDGLCPIHKTVPVELKGVNWFFKLSKYENQLRDLIKSDKINITPKNFKTEILSFMKDGLEDISFSRPKEVLEWGVQVPNDDTHVMYVWCDALTNYLTGATGFDKKFWDDTKMLNIIGKDILRFHALYWPAMLMSAKEHLPQNILVHGMILTNGEKMSKSLGNVVDPIELVNLYNSVLSEKSVLGDKLGSEFFRYFFLKNISPFLDGDFTFERAKELYNADLANGIGNLLSRVMKLSNIYLKEEEFVFNLSEHNFFSNSFTEYDVKSAFEYIFKLISDSDEYMQKNEPFKVVKVDAEKGKEMLMHLRKNVYTVGSLLAPFMPETSSLLKDLAQNNKMPEKPIFPRYE